MKKIQEKKLIISCRSETKQTLCFLKFLDVKTSHYLLKFMTIIIKMEKLFSSLSLKHFICE